MSTGAPAGGLRTVLVANRGEIALRIVRACRDAGLRSVAVYAGSEVDAPYVGAADDAVALLGATATDTYLDGAKLVAAATSSGADAVHPGYGFLSERADFAQAVIDAGLIWVGAPPDAIRDLGDKVRARHIAAEVGAPLLPGSPGPVSGPDEIVDFAVAHGLPVAIKAAFGGGGRGLRVARTMAEIPALLEAAQREAQGAFGRAECFVERYLERTRHVEAQVLADNYGAVIVAGTRDCSLQRRYQKLVEEAPAPYLSDPQRASIHEAAKAICCAAGYRGAGTVEFLLGADGTLSFLEVNTRLQVEHTVTEETAGIDLVREQFRIAAGEHLRFDADLEAHGHAIEFRINAEDPGRGFVPSTGTISVFDPPAGPGVRVDAGVQTGSVVGDRFDSLLAKVIVRGEDRGEAIERSRRALAELRIDGVTTVVAFHRAVLQHPDFTGELRVHTRWIESALDDDPSAFGAIQRSVRATRVVVEIGGRPLEVELPGVAALPALAAVLAGSGATRRTSDHAGTDGLVRTPMQGTIVSVNVGEGDAVEAGHLLATIEAMKMEHRLVAPHAGVVTDLAVRAGEALVEGSLVCRVRAVAPPA